MDESQDDSSEGSIVSYDSLESDDDDFSYSETSSSEESDNDMVDIPDDYSPEGVDSDDDSDNCCHWSRTQNNHNKINLNTGITPRGSPNVVLPEYTTPADLAERVLDDNFIDHIINCTNIHSQTDPKFMQHVGNIPQDGKGRAFIRGYLGIRIYFGLIRIPNVHYAWSTDPLKRIPEIPKVMSYNKYALVRKHFRVTDPGQLPDRQDADYHPLQNVKEGMGYLGNKTQQLWKLGSCIAIDEDRARVCSKSRRNKFKIRNPDKPIRMGWTVCKLGDVGENGGAFVYNHLVKCSDHTYTDTTNGKNYNVVEQLVNTGDIVNSGRTLVMDNAFPTMTLLCDSVDWKLRVIATQRGRIAHLPANVNQYRQRCKNWFRGYSQTLHNDDINLTFWNDSNAVVLLDNDFPAGEDQWDLIEIRSRQGNILVNAPLVARQYRSGYHFIDRSNQEGSYYNVDRKTVRKQNRVLEDAIETYALINTHTVYINSPNVIQGMDRDEIASDQFRFEIARVWFAKCRALNGRSSVHYPLCRSKRNRSIYSLIHSPRKGTHA